MIQVGQNKSLFSYLYAVFKQQNMRKIKNYEEYNKSGNCQYNDQHETNKRKKPSLIQKNCCLSKGSINQMIN